jgi:hypothetical protein
MSALADAATRIDEIAHLAERHGWPIVPCRGKHPGAYLGDDWQHKASSDPAVIRSRWSRWPGANPGVVVGDRFLAFDVDDPDALHELERALGPLPTTPGYLTGGDDPPGRYRLLFAHPGAALKASLADGGIQLIDGPARQVIVPPARHPVSGAAIEWDDHPDEVALAELPPAWLALVRAPKAPKQQPPEQLAAASERRRGDPLLRIPAVRYIEALTGRMPNRAGFVRCPFHNGGREAEPSLKLYGTGWACWGCAPQPWQRPGARCLGGDLYTFAALLWGYPVPLHGPAWLGLGQRLCDHLDRAFAT